MEGGAYGHSGQIVAACAARAWRDGPESVTIHVHNYSETIALENPLILEYALSSIAKVAIIREI